MDLTAQPLPKTIPADCGEETEITEPFFFGKAEEALRQTLSNAASKTLLISDGSGVFSEASCSPRTITVIFDGDCLPLFSMPDGVSCAVASGGAALLRAARYFAEVRGIDCTLIPIEADLDGVFETKGEIQISKERNEVPLRCVKRVICDQDLLKSSLSKAYLRTLLSRLSVLERKALNAFREERGKVLEAEIPSELTMEAIVRSNACNRIMESECGYAGEGIVLAERLRAQGEQYPEWRAFLQLSALYAAFFEKGKPRRYFTPDYRARAAAAGASYASAKIPSAEEYALRAITLERIRASFFKAALELLDCKSESLKKISAMTGEMLPNSAGDLTALGQLPEHVPEGLSAIIRDFGLMEWKI